MCGDDFEGLPFGSTLTVGSVRSQRIECICDQYNSRPKRNLTSLEAVRITRAIDVLVMVADNFRCLAQELYWPHYFGAYHGMQSHGPPLLSVELAGLADYAPAHPYLATVMHKGSYPNPSH